nr:MAG TPA: hypothetical protein [Caudoviricetes sp.]
MESFVFHQYYSSLFYYYIHLSLTFNTLFARKGEIK